MTIKTFTVVMATAFMWTACNNDTPQQSTAPAETATTASDATTQAAAPQDAALTPGVINTAAPAPAAAPSTQATAPTGGAVKPNPPHGQPGHVCGTPVGSSLDGSAAGTPTTQPAAKSVTMPPPSGGAAAVAPGTNPPHGQPGHVCGTPVGSPLPKQ